MEPIRNEGDIGANRQYFEGILASCFEDAKDQFPLDENGKLNVLSVGCGNGFDAGAVLMYFPNSVYKGIDINGSLIKSASDFNLDLDQDRVEFVQEDATEVGDNEKNKYGLIIMRNP